MLELVPLTLTEAHAFVEGHHRHHDRDESGRFAIGAARVRVVVAVAIVGRAKARLLDADDYTAEVTRLCSIETGRFADGAGKLHASCACSMLYAACWRAWRAMGGAPAGHVHLARGERDFAEGGGLDLHRRGRRRFMGPQGSTACRRAPYAAEAPMGACGVTTPEATG